MYLSKIANPKCPNETLFHDQVYFKMINVTLANGKIMKEPEFILVKYLTHSVFLYLSSMSLYQITVECKNYLLINTLN